MGENQKRVLQMLAEGKISVDEASRLLSALGKDTDGTGRSQEPGKGKPGPKYLYVQVEPKEGCADNAEGLKSARSERVNVRIPVALIRAGMKLKSLIPPKAADNVSQALKEKGIAFDIRNLKDEDLEQFVDALSDTEINVDSDEATIKVHAE
jgi:hypothetical protein